MKTSEIDSRVNRVEEEARLINTRYLDLTTLKQLSEQLYENQTAFILGTGFQLSVNQDTHALEVV